MSDNMQKDPETILCDMCTEEDRKPARKTCMKCEISMCVQHLQAHLTTPVLLQTHPLTEPMALCGTTKCPQHGKLVEYYCLDDMTCVCVSCAIEDQHRLHNMKTFSTAHKELMEKLRAEQQALQEKTDDENVSLEKWEKSEREKLGGCSVRLVEAVTNLRDISLTSVQSSVSARMVALRTSKSSMLAAQNEKDTFRFLQMYSQVHQDLEKAKAVDLRKGLEPGSDRDKLVEEIKQEGEKMMEQAGHLWSSLLTLVDPENHEELLATGSDLFFDPQIFGPGLLISKDKRKVFHNSWIGNHPTYIFRIQSTLPATHFKRWVISLSKNCDWTIGLCDKTYVKDMENGDVFGLRCQGQQLFSLTMENTVTTGQSGTSNIFGSQKTEPANVENKRVVSLQKIDLPYDNVTKKMSRPKKIEVVWNFPDSLSFFSRIGQHQRIKILTVMLSFSSGSCFTGDLVPFVGLKVGEMQQSCTAPVSGKFGSVQQHEQRQWKCTCGRVYNETKDGYISQGYTYQKSSQPQCCGRVIGSSSATEILCELV